MAPGSPIAEIGAPGGLEVVADVLSTEGARVGPGMSTALDGWGGARAVPARVRLVEPQP